MPQRCLDCDKVTLPNDETGESAKQCAHCQSLKLECDHPSGHYDQEKRCFVCGTCGHEYHHGLKQLRTLAQSHSSLSELGKLLN